MKKSNEWFTQEKVNQGLDDLIAKGWVIGDFTRYAAAQELGAHPNPEFYKKFEVWRQERLAQSTQPFVPVTPQAEAEFKKVLGKFSDELLGVFVAQLSLAAGVLQQTADQRVAKAEREASIASEECARMLDEWSETQTRLDTSLTLCEDLEWQLADAHGEVSKLTARLDERTELLLELKARIWGPDSIFGVRVDRDEKGDTNVDVFVAPKYTKKTKHTEKVAVSLTRDLKRLVAESSESDEKAHKWAVGRALQDAIFVYFRDEMRLPGVQRGEPKANSVSDWKTAEQLRMEELERMKAELEEERRTADEERIRNNAKIASKQAKLDAELDAAAVLTTSVEADVASAAETTCAASALMETAKAEMARVTAKREQLERDRDREAAQLALLVRAADDDNGLELQAGGDSFSMAKSQMTQPEKAAYESPWSTGIAAIGRKLADALQTVRRTLLRLADKETKLDRDRLDHERSVATHQEDVRTHENAIRKLDIRIAKINDEERLMHEQIAAVTESVRAAGAIEREASAAKEVQDHWLTVIAATASASDEVTIDDSDKVVVASQVMVALPEPIRSTLQKDAPEWAKNVIRQRLALAVIKQQAEAAEADWKGKLAAVTSDQRRIEKSRKVLDAIVSGEWEVAIADGLMTLRHDSDGDSRNVRRIPLADMEPSLLHAAQAFTHLSATTESVLDLHDSLKKERSALAKSQPERASQIEEEQQRSDDKIGKVLRLPPGWGQGIGM